MKITRETCPTVKLAVVLLPSKNKQWFITAIQITFVHSFFKTGTKKKKDLSIFVLNTNMRKWTMFCFAMFDSVHEWKLWGGEDNGRFGRSCILHLGYIYIYIYTLIHCIDRYTHTVQVDILYTHWFNHHPVNFQLEIQHLKKCSMWVKPEIVQLTFRNRQCCNFTL